MTTLAYADDLAVYVEENNAERLMLKTNRAPEIIVEWLSQHRLELAVQKTEAIILKGPRKRYHIRFLLNGTVIKPNKTLKYLGVHLNNWNYFGTHVRETVQKAENRLTQLTKIMPNIGGPSSQRRAMLSGGIHSILIYAAPEWHEALRIKKYRELLERTQRKILLRVI